MASSTQCRSNTKKQTSTWVWVATVQLPCGHTNNPSSGPPHVPITTTSPAPPELGSIKYPSLMSQHQLKQGYVPSLQSMFASTSISQAPDSSLLFDSKPQTSGLYNNILPSQSAPVAPVIPPYPTHMPVPESHQPHQPLSWLATRRWAVALPCVPQLRCSHRLLEIIRPGVEVCATTQNFFAYT